MLEQIARDYPQTPDAPRSLYQLGQILWNRHDNAQALAIFNEIIARYPASPILDRALYAAGDIYEWFGNREEAIARYNQVRLDFSGSEKRDDATWRLAWLYYRSGELADAYRIFKLLASEGRDGAVRTAARYWQGRAAEKAGDTEMAKQSYREVYDDGVESYYQALAENALARLGEAPIRPHYEPPTRGRDLELSSTTPRVAFHLGRARA